MDGLPVTVRLLDPPLHEFLPSEPEIQASLARSMGWDSAASSRCSRPPRVSSSSEEKLPDKIGSETLQPASRPRAMRSRSLPSPRDSA